MHFRSQKKSSGDVSLSDYIETGKDGNALSLMDVMKKNGVDFAFPSTSVYVEKMPAK